MDANIAAIITALGSLLGTIALAYKQYCDSKDKIKRSEISALWEIIEGYKKQIEDLEDDISNLKREIDALESENRALREKNEELSLQVSHLRDKLDRYRDRLKALDGQDGQEES